MRVFVSCTTSELGMFRDALCDRPAEWWGTAPRRPELSSMTDAKAESIPPVDWSIRQAAKADLVVLLLGQHHGAMAEAPDARHCGVEEPRLRAAADGIAGWDEVNEPHRFSYTQWEVLAAVAARVPILVFSPDRRSSDDDLHACRQNEEAAWLQDRQGCFCRWVRSRYSEDHFANRLDLVNKVRKAILRQQQRRRVSRVIAAIVALLVVIGTAWGIAQKWQASADRSRAEYQQADRLQAEKRRQKYAVALGGSLAMLGRSSAGAGRPIFEKSLVGLGLPQNQVGELSDEYNRVDASVQGDHIDTLGFQARKASLGQKAIIRANVVRPIPASHVEFGQSATELLLLIQFWGAQPDQDALLLAARDALARFQAACGRVELPEDVREEVAATKVSGLNVPEQRVDVAQLVLRCLRPYEMEPPISGRQKETE